MNQRKKRLGRGLEALLSGISEPVAGEQPEEPKILPMHATAAPAAPTAQQAEVTSAGTSAAPEPVSSVPESKSLEPVGQPAATTETSVPPTRGEDQILRLPVNDIEDNPFQPRRDFTEPEIVSLAESLKEHDMLQPVLVRRTGDKYQLISGERRLRAAIRAGWSTVPAQLREANDRLVAELAIVENLQRKDLNAIEKALSFRRYLDEHHCTQEELAGRLKIDRSTIANLIRLLDLPEIVQEAVRTSVISAGHARALLPLGDAKVQLKHCNRIQIEGWSVRETERQSQDYLRSLEDADDPTGSKPKVSKQSPQIASLEQEFKMALGTKVEIKKSSRGKGKITINFASIDEFERIRQVLCEQTLKSHARAG